ncbi:MAG: MATE family efflux transporter [Spirochaetia bacterium]
MKGAGSSEYSDVLPLKQVEGLGWNSILLRFGLPSVVGAMGPVLLNLIDGIFLSGISVYALAGVTLCFPIFNLIGAVGIAVGSGAAAIISQKIGTGQEDQNSWVFTAAVAVSAFLGIVVFVSIYPFRRSLLTLLGARMEVLDAGLEYLSIILPASAVTMMIMLANSGIRAVGAIGTAVFLSLSSSILNIILDPILIFGFSLGVKGAALATVFSQIVTLSVAVFFLFKRKLLPLVPSIPLYRIKQILIKGIPFFLFQVSLTIIVLLINAVSVQFGAQAISASGMLMRIFVLIVLPVIGFTYGLHPLAGYYHYSGQYKRYTQLFYRVVFFTSVYCAAVEALLLITPGRIFSLILFNSSFIEQLQTAIRFGTPFIWTLGLQITVIVFLQNTKYNKISGFIVFLRQVILLIPSLFILPLFLGYAGIPASLAVSDIGGFCFVLLFSKLTKGVFKRNEK